MVEENSGTRVMAALLCWSFPLPEVPEPRASEVGPFKVGTHNSYQGVFIVRVASVVATYPHTTSDSFLLRVGWSFPLPEVPEPS